MGERRDRLTAARLADVFDAGDQVADLAGAELRNRGRHRSANTDLDRLLRRARLHEHQLRTVGQATVHHPDRADDAAVLVVLAVEDQRLQWRVGVALRRRNALADRVEQADRSPSPVFAEMRRMSSAGMPSTVSISIA